MARIQVTKYKKRYMTKAVYNCKRYLFYIPVRLGARLDLSIDYEVEFQDPIIVLTPRDLKNVKHAIKEIEGKETSVSKSVTPLNKDP